MEQTDAIGIKQVKPKTKTHLVCLNTYATTRPIWLDRHVTPA